MGDVEGGVANSSHAGYESKGTHPNVAPDILLVTTPRYHCLPCYDPCSLCCYFVCSLPRRWYPLELCHSASACVTLFSVCFVFVSFTFVSLSFRALRHLYPHSRLLCRLWLTRCINWTYHRLIVATKTTFPPDM